MNAPETHMALTGTSPPKKKLCLGIIVLLVETHENYYAPQKTRTFFMKYRS
jgi:hypothetical protein